MDNYKTGDIINYHANNDILYIEYPYDDIYEIYKTLYNNKIYNLIYSSVLCKWIMENYTDELESSSVVISYGYSNDDIREEVEAAYAKQRLS